MPLHFAPNLSMLYCEVPFLDRFERAALAGFRWVEFLFPYEFAPAAIRLRLEEYGLQASLFNINPGDTSKNERGSMGDPDRRDFFRQTFEQALNYATHLNVPRIHIMIGNRNFNYSYTAQIDCALENLAWAAPMAAREHVNLLIEPLNVTDMPEYLIHTNTEGMRIVSAANQPNVKLQFDLYHTQMTSGNLIYALNHYFPHIGHIQISDVPGRHQPGTGEINYPNIFAAIERLEYTEPIGLEYRPLGESDASLAWLPRAARG